MLDKITHQTIMPHIIKSRELLYITRFEKKDFPSFSTEDKMNALNTMMFKPNESGMLIKLVHFIEWTPDVLCLAAYYMVRTNDEFWIVMYTNYDDIDHFDVKYFTNVKSILIDNIMSVKTSTIHINYITLPHINDVYSNTTYLINTISKTEINIYNLINIINNKGRMELYYIIRFNDNIYVVPIIENYYSQPLFVKSIN